METYRHYLRGELVGEYPMPEPGIVNAQDWGDPNPNFPLCSVRVDYPPESPTPHTAAPLRARVRVLLRWNVMDRLRYWGLWPRRDTPSYRGKIPAQTVWWDIWHWARTKGTCRVVGHRPEEWFHDTYRQRYRCGRCDMYNPEGPPRL